MTSHDNNHAQGNNKKNTVYFAMKLIDYCINITVHTITAAASTTTTTTRAPPTDTAGTITPASAVHCPSTG